MNGYQVQDAWKKHQRRNLNEQFERSARARALVEQHMPEAVDETGQVCGWAVAAVLSLWWEHGEGKIRRSQVREERARRLARFAEHGSHPTRPRIGDLEAAA